jgi:8-oxo-dGTP diphosphatase
MVPGGRIAQALNSLQAGRDYIGVGVGALIFDNEGRILITQRGPKAKNERGLWEIPGGSVEYGETFEQAIIREIREELGIRIRVRSLHAVCDHILPEENQHWVSPTYICEIVEGVPSIQEPEKCSNWGWFTLQEAQLLHLSKVTQHDIEVLLQNPLG